MTAITSWPRPGPSVLFQPTLKQGNLVPKIALIRGGDSIGRLPKDVYLDFALTTL